MHPNRSRHGSRLTGLALIAAVLAASEAFGPSPTAAGGVDGMAERLYAPGTGFPGARHSDLLAARLLAALPPPPGGWVVRDETDANPDLTSLTGALVVRRAYRQLLGAGGVDVFVAVSRYSTQLALEMLPEPALRNAEGEPVSVGDGQDGVLRFEPESGRGLLTSVLGRSEVVVANAWQVDESMMIELARRIDIATLRALGGEQTAVSADDVSLSDRTGSRR